MAPNQQPDWANPKKHFPLKEKLFIGLIMALVLLALPGLFVRYKQHLKDTVSPYQPVHPVTSFSYKSLESETLKSSSGSLDFKKPADLIKVLAIQNPPGIDFAEYSGPDRLLPYISYLSASAVSDSGSSKGTQLAAELASASASDHQAAIKNLADYINGRKTAFYNAPVIAEPAALALPSAQAWAANFTLSADAGMPKIDHPTNAPQSQGAKNTSTLKTPAYTGKIVIALGRSTVYYFMIYDLSSNWQANQNVWTQVINSLRVN